MIFFKSTELIEIRNISNSIETLISNMDIVQLKVLQSPGGLMDKAPDFGSGDYGFESHPGQNLHLIFFCYLPERGVLLAIEHSWVIRTMDGLVVFFGKFSKSHGYIFCKIKFHINIDTSITNTLERLGQRCNNQIGSKQGAVFGDHKYRH